jgi:hypothetical protein
MTALDLHTLVLPARVRAVVLNLLTAIEVGQSAEAVNLAGQRAEGFVLGLETGSAFSQADIEALYRGFDVLVRACLNRLRHA